MPALEPGEVRIGDWQAAWTRFDLDVRNETGEALAAEPLELYALKDPEASIDAAALLRERSIPDPPYWALVWTGARAIAAMLATRELVPSTRVLDLGCGLGLSGLAAARRGAAVTFADYIEDPLAFVRATLERSGLGNCDVRRCDFTASGDDRRRYDLILAADIVYDPAHYRPLATFLDRHLAAGGCILLTESLRADASTFLEGLAALGYSDRKQPLWVLEEGRRERTWLHELRRSSPGA